MDILTTSGEAFAGTTTRLTCTVECLTKLRMSLQYGKLCSLILSELFGESTEKVGRDLYKSGQKPLNLISNSTSLSKDEVQRSLCVLIKYGLVSFVTGKIPSIAEYELHSEKILYLLRYPKYLMLMKTNYGDEAEAIIEEMFKHGVNSVSQIILYAYKQITSTAETEKKRYAILKSLREMFELLVNKQYIGRCPTLTGKKIVPEFIEEFDKQYQPLKVDVQKLILAVTDDSITFDESVIWEINFDRFHQDMRDDLLITAMGRRFPSGGGEVLRLMLHQMKINSNPWAAISKPILLSEIKNICQKTEVNGQITKYLDEFMAVMEDDCDGFLLKSNLSSTAYHVNLKKAIEELTWCILANGVDARFGPNAARIFRLIREQKFIEQEEIQKKGMLPDKEAKYLTYSLLQSGWIQQHELKKGFQKAGPTKTFFLFCIDVEQVVRMNIEMCYKALCNAIVKREHEKLENKCLLDKEQRIDAIALHMKKEGATEEQIAEIKEMVTPPEIALLETIREKVNLLSLAELQIDETLFVLQLYLKMQSFN